MKHTIYHNELQTELTVDETLCENISITVDNLEGLEVTHYLSPDDLENLIHLLRYVKSKKDEINPNYGRRVSALSLASIKAQKERSNKSV